MNTMEDVLYKLASTKGSGVSHSFMRETLKSMSIETLEVVMEIVKGTLPLFWISPIATYI